MSYDELASILLSCGDGLTPGKAKPYVTKAPGGGCIPPRPLFPVERVSALAVVADITARGGLRFARVSAATSTDRQTAGWSPISSLLDNPDLSPAQIGSGLPRSQPTAGFYEAPGVGYVSSV